MTLLLDKEPLPKSSGELAKLLVLPTKKAVAVWIASWSGTRTTARTPMNVRKSFRWSLNA